MLMHNMDKLEFIEAFKQVSASAIDKGLYLAECIMPALHLPKKVFVVLAGIIIGFIAYRFAAKHIRKYKKDME